jgi:hypothetical protein
MESGVLIANGPIERTVGGVGRSLASRATVIISEHGKSQMLANVVSACVLKALLH